MVQESARLLGNSILRVERADIEVEALDEQAEREVPGQDQGIIVIIIIR